MFKNFVIIGLIFLLEVNVISGELSESCVKELSTLEIDYFVVEMEGKNIVSKIHMTSALSECKDQITIKAAYYNMERESYGDSIPITVEEFTK